MKGQYILAMIVVLLLMLWVGSEILKATAETPVEGFASSPSGITLNFCPLWAPQIQSAKGNTDCCEGTLLDGKCTGKSFCTMSPTHDGILSCIDAWRNYFVSKSKQCPPSMANYFEEVKVQGGRKGCSASQIKEDGSAPVNLSSPRCVIYNTEKENRENPNSCFVEKERLKVRCPPLPGYTSRVENVLMKQAGVDKFGSYVCTYSNALGQRNSCNDEPSLIQMWDRQNPNWRMNKSKYSELNNISCKTFLERERQKELERQRAEAERRRAEEEKRKRQAAESKFRNLQSFFNRFKSSAQNAANKAKQALEAEKRKSQQKLQEMQNRLKKCV